MKRTIFSLCAALTALGATADWQDDLWLGRGAFWTSRVPVTITNSTSANWEGKTIGVPVARLPLKGARIEELRLTDAKGVQTEYGVWTKDGAKRVTEGIVPDDGIFAIPAVCPAQGAATYRIYYGNPNAWGLADFWKKRPESGTDGSATAGAAEKLDVREIGAGAKWLDAKWQYRVPVRLANFSDSDSPDTLASFALPEVLRSTRNPEFVLTLNGRELPTCAIGTRLLFTCSLPAKSVTTCYVYVCGGAAAQEAAEESAELKSALGSQIPSDQVLVRRQRLANSETFEAILNGKANLVRNGSFEKGAQGWSSSKTKDVGFEIASGGRFGASFAKMTIPSHVKPNWSGWRQTVKVRPGKSYFYGAFVSGDNLENYASVHAHLLTENRNLSTGGMANAGRGVRGTVPWTPVFGVLRTTADTEYANIQLTMNGTGVVAHDGVLMVEYAEARPGDSEFAPGATNEALKVAQTDPVVKVFRETIVNEKAGVPFAVSLARNETESLQLAVKSGTGGAVEVFVEGIPFKTEIGRVDYVPVDWPTAYYSCTTPEWELRFPRSGGQSDGWSGWWPDPIVPASGGTLAPNVTQAFWINFTTDARTKPGVHAGRVVWKLNGKVVRTDPLSVKVWDFALPENVKFPAVYDLRVGDHWKVLGRNHDERREKLWAFMAKKKACPDTADGDLKLSKAADGTVTADFTDYDRVATGYFDHYKFPFSYTPRAFYCFGWGLPPKKFLGEDPYEGKWPYDGADRAKLRPAYKRVFQQALKLYWDHVKEKGWADKITLYISDEPHFWHTNIVQQMIACCKMIHEVDPAIRIYSSTWRHCPEWDDSLDAWGAGHYGCFPVDEMTRLKAAGKHVFWTTDGQMCTDTPYCAVERMLPHYAHKYGAGLYEFWGSTWLTYDPWKFGWHSYIRQSDTPGKTYWVRYPAGDGYLIYPPKPGMGDEPVSTVRMEAVRDGVEDHCYLELLAERAKTDAKAAEILDEFHSLMTIPNAGGRFSTKILPVPERIGELRLRAGEILSGH